MRIHITVFGTVIALALGAMPAMAQMQHSAASQNAAAPTYSETPVVVIFSGGAPTTDLNMNGYRAFDQFAQQHPDIVQQLNHDPRLVNDPWYAQRHPAFAEFLRMHPKVAEDLAENPGNYLPTVRA